MMRAILAIFLIFLSFGESAADYDKKLVFVNKTYKKDFQNSIRLFQSFVKYVEQDIDFYFILPDAELFEFRNKLREIEVDTARARFVTEGDLFEKCKVDIKKLNKMPGWEVQQVAKFCFAETDIAKNYFTMDSDIYFTREFKPYEVLFKNGKPKTYAPKKYKKETDNKKKFFSRGNRLDEFYKIKSCFKDHSKNYSYYVNGYALWSSHIVKKMRAYTKKHCGMDFENIINFVPYEMQWYVEYIRNIEPQNFIPLGSLFTVVEVGNSGKICYPSAGFPWHYGVLYNNIKGENYSNNCGVTKNFFKLHYKRMERWFQILRGYNV